MKYRHIVYLDVIAIVATIEGEEEHETYTAKDKEEEAKDCLDVVVHDYNISEF